MAGIQASNGIITGIDIQGTVTQLLNLAAQPRTRLADATKQLQNEQVALTSLTALVVGVQLTTDRLGQSSLFTSSTATSSNATALKATVSGTPLPGSHTFVPVRQATAQQLTSTLLGSKDQLVGAGEVVIHQGGFLDESATLDSLNGGAGVARGSIRITDRSGASKTVDLRFAQTINDVVDAINKTDGLRVVASVNGDRLKLTDTSSGTSTLSVTEVSGGTTAADLGISAISTTAASATGTSIQSLSNRTSLSSLLDKRGLAFPATGAALKFDLKDGTSVEFTSTLNPNTATLGDLLSAINTAGNGKLTASIGADGKTLAFNDTTTGANNFAISNPNGSLAKALGIEQSVSGATITSGRLVAGLNDVLLSSLNGGKGLGTLGKLTLTDRANVSATVDLASAKTLGEVIDTINQAGNGVRAQLNRSRTGIEIVDTTGSTTNQLIVADFADATNTATKLQIAKSVNADSINSGSLNKQWVTENTLLTDWNKGKGVTFGSIRITDSAGVESAVNFKQTAPKTVGDVLKAINNLAVGVEARINETGDGILLVDTAGGSSQLTVVDVGAGKSAQQLGIAGTAKSLTVNNVAASGIDGTQTLRVETTATTTVTQLTEKLNALAGPVNASILSFGNSGVRLVLNGTQTGATGRVALDSDLNLGFSETVTAKDALLAYGASDISGGVLVSSSTNEFDNVVAGVKLEVLASSTTAVTVSVSKSSDGIAKQLKTVVDQYNKVRDKIKTDASYDSTTKTSGVLFGTSAVLRVDLAFGKLFTGTINGAGSIKSITQLGVRLNDQGRLEFDESKLNAALESDPAAVQEFFTKEKTGFSARAKDIADTLAGVKNGALLARSQALQAKIDQNNARIDGFTSRLDKQRTRLLNQFYNLETSISKIRNNLTAINSISATITSSTR
ncbi:MAG: flagellar filament capping protein FliD [Pirellulaceae bacterium]|nr:flagellar filament capping protein FliD [Pirellulaceae bacterium]